MLGAKCKVYYYKLNSIIMVANMVDVQEYDKVPNKVHGNKYWEVLSFVCFVKSGNMLSVTTYAISGLYHHPPVRAISHKLQFGSSVADALYTDRRPKRLYSANFILWRS